MCKIIFELALVSILNHLTKPVETFGNNILAICQVMLLQYTPTPTLFLVDDITFSAFL